MSSETYLKPYKFELKVAPIPSADEITTRNLMHTIRADFWNPESAVLANIFENDWMSALDFDDIVSFAAGRYRVVDNENSRNAFRKELRRLTRLGFLRGRQHGGRRLWEVNY